MKAKCKSCYSSQIIPYPTQPLLSPEEKIMASPKRGYRASLDGLRVYPIILTIFVAFGRLCQQKRLGKE
jgi:hypothetical protein